MFLSKPAVSDFVALHEGSIVDEKTRPTVELFPEEKYPWLSNTMIGMLVQPMRNYDSSNLNSY